MELSSMMFWNIILTLVIAPAFWMFRSMMAEVKRRLDILLNRTREDYATKNELREDMSRVMEALHRVEDKLDRALTNECSTSTTKCCKFTSATSTASTTTS